VPQARHSRNNYFHQTQIKVITDENQLLSQSEAAALKEMSLNAFKYRLNHQAGAPKPVVIGRGHLFYRESEILAWKPETHNTGRKPCKMKQPKR
jgi:predicted DNA-binding transcriptional regulator AlpA